MIYYFSGTGNSRYIAETLSGILSNELRFIPDEKPDLQIFDGNNVGFVFPVYSWGIPPLVIDFIDRLPENFWNEIKLNQSYIWAVMTCGDEVAKAPEMFLSHIKVKGITEFGIWSVIMPNNYVLLPGFNVDTKDIEDKKLKNVEGRIIEISKGIIQEMKTIDVVRGSFPFIKTKLIYPLFRKWGINPSKWHYTPACVGCGKCKKACPLSNIKMHNGHPLWETRCCSCLACYHICPYHAVAYGKITAKKGQYFFPLNK